jgi:hypothetical protein
MQEFDTAKSAILAVNSCADVVSKRVDKYPIVVKIYDEDAEVLWTADQRSLFRKNPERRTASIEQIKKVISAYESEADKDD